MDKQQLTQRIKDVAYLEGDFVLRSGNRRKYCMGKHLTDDVTLIAGAKLGSVTLVSEQQWKPMLKCTRKVDELQELH